MFRFFAFGEETGSIEDRTCSPAAPPILLESSPIVNWHDPISVEIGYRFRNIKTDLSLHFFSLLSFLLFLQNSLQIFKSTRTYSILIRRKRKERSKKNHPRFFCRKFNSWRDSWKRCCSIERFEIGRWEGKRDRSLDPQKPPRNFISLPWRDVSAWLAQRALLFSSTGEEGEVIKRRNCHVAELMSTRGGRRRIY